LLTPTNASWEIDRVLREGFLQKRPVYLQLPSDVADAEIEAPSRPLSLHLEGDRTNTVRVAALILERLRRSKCPAILADADVGRFGLVELLLTIAEANGLPIAYLIAAKGLIPENNRNVIGVYRGAASSPHVRTTIEQSDCLLCLGTRFTDTATGLFTHQLNIENMINIQFNYTVAGGVFFEDVLVAELLKQIARRDNEHRETALDLPNPGNDSLTALDFNAPINQDDFWQAIQGFLREDDIIVSDTGTSFFASSRLKLGEGVSFLGQSIWAALGYGIPASLGASCAARERRVLVFVGDGGLQMSVQELSTLFWKNLTPVIFLLNNDGYTIERLIHGPDSPYNDIHRWNYAALPEIFETGNHCTVRTVRINGELQEALSNSEDRTKLHFIEIVLPRLDASNVLIKFAKRAAEFNAPQNLKMRA
jgi:indolepyruvate decarboxylase